MTALEQALFWLEGPGAALVWSGFLVFVRIGAIVALLPVFGEQSVPARLRLAIALAFTMLVAPLVAAPVQPDIPAILAEVVTGLMLGAGLRLLVLALNLAGAIAAQSTSLAQILGVAGAEPAPAMSHILVVAGLALATTLGLHLRIVEFMAFSYDMFPQGSLPASEEAAAWGVAQVARAFSLGFSIAAPFAIGGLLYYVALGAINRAMPTLMVAFIGAPALTGGGLVFLAMLSPAMLGLWLGALNGFLLDPLASAR